MAGLRWVAAGKDRSHYFRAARQAPATARDCRRRGHETHSEKPPAEANEAVKAVFKLCFLGYPL
jgi:hypothetical protein